MAVGDSVSVYLHTATTFVPAAGIQIMILSPMLTDGAQYVGFSDGTGNNTARQYVLHSQGGMGATQRWIITNTDYFYTLNAAAWTGFNGIQIK